MSVLGKRTKCRTGGRISELLFCCCQGQLIHMGACFETPYISQRVSGTGASRDTFVMAQTSHQSQVLAESHHGDGGYLIQSYVA
jgi:hypothetical protein